jgi:hypothetical protein
MTPHAHQRKIIMAAPSPDEAQAAISIPHGAAYDWLTWVARGVLIFVLGVVIKMYRDVQSLLGTRATAEALAPIRDAQRLEILEVVKELRDDLKEHGKSLHETREEVANMRKENHHKGGA